LKIFQSSPTYLGVSLLTKVPLQSSHPEIEKQSFISICPDGAPRISELGMLI